MPVALGPEGGPVVSASRYGRGRLAAFGAQRMISECCKPVHKNGGRRPALDQLVLNTAIWAAGTQVRIRQAGKYTARPPLLCKLHGTSIQI